VKCGAHRLNMRGVDMVLAKWHNSLSSRHGHLDGRAIERFFVASREEMLGALSAPLNVEYAPIQAVTLRRDRGSNLLPDHVL
jgi:hypothetical protein